MDLQNIFYIVSIIFMLLVLAAVISIAVAINHMRDTALGLRHDITRRIDNFKEAAKPQIGAGLGTIATTLLAFGIKRIFKR